MNEKSYSSHSWEPKTCYSKYSGDAVPVLVCKNCGYWIFGFDEWNYNSSLSCDEYMIFEILSQWSGKTPIISGLRGTNSREESRDSSPYGFAGGAVTRFSSTVAQFWPVTDPEFHATNTSSLKWCPNDSTPGKCKDLLMTAKEDYSYQDRYGHIWIKFPTAWTCFRCRLFTPYNPFGDFLTEPCDLRIVRNILESWLGNSPGYPVDCYIRHKPRFEVHI